MLLEQGYILFYLYPHARCDHVNQSNWFHLRKKIRIETFEVCAFLLCLSVCLCVSHTNTPTSNSEGVFGVRWTPCTLWCPSGAWVSVGSLLQTSRQCPNATSHTNSSREPSVTLGLEYFKLVLLMENMESEVRLTKDDIWMKELSTGSLVQHHHQIFIE